MRSLPRLVVSVVAVVAFVAGSLTLINLDKPPRDPNTVLAKCGVITMEIDRSLLAYSPDCKEIK